MKPHERYNIALNCMLTGRKSPEEATPIPERQSLSGSPVPVVGINTMRHTLCKSCFSLVLVIKNNGFVIKDCIIKEGCVRSIVKLMGHRTLGGWVNCNLMAAKDELPFLTSGLLLS